MHTTHLGASHCHYCNVDFVLFHKLTCYTNSLLLCIHVNIHAYLLDTTCTLVATCMILGSIEYIQPCGYVTLTL
jgi:hypothetical protein